MSNGRYFEIDKESKSLDSRMVVFNYLRYKNTKTYDKGERIQPEYPIYAVFMKDGVRFYLHTIEQDDNNKISHYLGCVLFLPLSLDNDFHCEMTAILNGALNTNIHINSGISENHDVNGFDKAIFKKENSISNENKTSEKGISKRQLILDFMFDMEHSSVFKNSVMYDKVYSRFHEHHLYNAINTKAEYKFWQKECIKSNTDIFSIEMFSRIERKWIEIITNNKSEYLFHESSWFNDNVDEMNDVYESEFSCLDLYKRKVKNEDVRTKKIKNAIEATSKISRDWYMSKYRLDGVLRIRYGEYFNYVLWGIYIPVVLLAIFLGFYPYFMYTIHDMTKILIVVTLLLLPILFYKLPKLSVKRPLFKRKTLPVIILPRLFAGICAGWMTVGLSDIVLDIYTKYALCAFLIFFIIVFSFVYISVKNILVFSKKRTACIISLFLTSVSMVYSVLLGYILFKLYEGKSVDNFNPINCAGDAKTLLTFSSLSMFIGVFINMLFHNKSISSYE